MPRDRDSKRSPPKRSAVDSPVYRHPDAAVPPPARTPSRPSEPVEREPVWARRPALGHKSGGAPPSKSAPRRDPPRETAPARASGPYARPREAVPVIEDNDDANAAGFDRDAQRRREVRIFGRAACLAVGNDRPQAIRKIYYSRERSRELAPLLEKLAAARIGFREVADDDLSKLAASGHHEGIVCDVLRKEQPEFADLLTELSREPGPACLIALEGVGNPHNFGAILRSAVHFGIRAVLIPADSGLTLAGAVYRVAEGAAERIPVVRYEQLNALREHAFELIAAATAGERTLYEHALPTRSVLMFGAEGPGLDSAALKLADHRYAIPGSGLVDSLNVAQAVAVMSGEWWRTRGD